MLETLKSRSRPAVLDGEVFSDLYRQITPSIYNYCLFRVGDRQVAEDLTADTFERAWRARRRYRPDRASFSTWLFTIARRVTTDWLRRRARRPETPLHEQHPDAGPQPESCLEANEKQRRLRGLLLQLSDSDQEYIALKFGAGITNREIARLLGKSESAVGSAIHRVMRRLRGQWQENET